MHIHADPSGKLVTILLSLAGLGACMGNMGVTGYPLSGEARDRMALDDKAPKGLLHWELVVQCVSCYPWLSRGDSAYGEILA